MKNQKPKKSNQENNTPSDSTTENSATDTLGEKSEQTEQTKEEGYPHAKSNKYLFLLLSLLTIIVSSLIFYIFIVKGTLPFQNKSHNPNWKVLSIPPKKGDFKISLPQNATRKTITIDQGKYQKVALPVQEPYVPEKNCRVYIEPADLFPKTKCTPPKGEYVKRVKKELKKTPNTPVQKYWLKLEKNFWIQQKNGSRRHTHYTVYNPNTKDCLHLACYLKTNSNQKQAEKLWKSIDSEFDQIVSTIQTK